MHALVTRRPEIAFRLLAAFRKQPLVPEEQLERVAHRPVSERVAEQLLKWTGSEDGDWVVRGYTKEDLASAVGAALQTVCLELKQLEEAGYVSVRQRAISLLQRQRLQHSWQATGRQPSSQAVSVEAG